MNEDFLYHVWQFKLFSDINLTTIDGQGVSIVKAGLQNTNAGPDFLNAHIKLNNQLWVGNVEMHVKASDWYLHKHEEDTNYDAVVLHVVWEHDAVVFMRNNTPIPTLEIKNFVSKELVLNYKKLVFNKQSWIPCEKQLFTVDKFLLENWLERMYFERLAQKSFFIKELLTESNQDFEAVLFQLLAKNFGLNVNGGAFLQLAKSIDFALVRKERFNLEKLIALFFGQAGFLEEVVEVKYHQQLKERYQYLKHKYKLQPVSKKQFQFFRLRPQNFPTIRIVQLACLYFSQQNLFSKLMSCAKKEDFYLLFSFEMDAFWKTHYTFESVSKKSAKKLSKSFINLLLINTIIPLKFVYAQSKSEIYKEDILLLMKQISAEKNNIISKFSELKINSSNAFESQALLELNNTYCTNKRCLQCAIGASLLKS